jgi:hypothetical protein
VRGLSKEPGYLLVDLIVGLTLFGFVLLAIYYMYRPTFALSQRINSRLSTQQDIRLALDRVARFLHETTTAPGRLKVYTEETGCAGGYQGCVGFVTARSGNDCTGAFQLIDGAPNWQATLYLWRDTASNELRLSCSRDTTFPVDRWPPRALNPFVVVGTRVVDAAVALEAAEGTRPTSIAIALREQAAGDRGAPTNFLNKTIFLPQNR